MQETEALHIRETNAAEAKKRRALGQHKVALIDAGEGGDDEIHLRCNGEDIEWPATWPPRVDGRWLTARGYRVILL